MTETGSAPSPMTNRTNKKKNMLLGGYLIFAGIAAAASAAVQLMLLLTDYDFTLGLYNSGSVLPETFAVLLLAAVAILLTLPIIGKKTELPSVLPPVSRGLTFVSALTGFALIATVVMQLFMNLTFEISLEGWKSILAAALEIAMLVFALPSAGYFIIMAIRREPYRRSTAALGFFPVLWAASYLMCVYFDTSTTLNNPLRIIEQAALIALMVFMLMELRTLIGRAKPHLYMMFGMIALVMITASSLPSLILTLAMKMSVSVDTIYDAAKLCLAAYIAVRLTSVVRAKTTETTETIETTESNETK
jgi:hypothetical protein